MQRPGKKIGNKQHGFHGNPDDPDHTTPARRIVALLTPDVYAINSLIPAGTESIFLGDISLLRRAGFEVIAAARGGLKSHGVLPLYYPAAFYRIILSLFGKLAPSVVWKIKSLLEMMALFSVRRVMRAADCALLYNFPLAACMYPEKSIVFFHREGRLPVWTLGKSRYKRMRFVFCSAYLKRQFLDWYPTIPEEHTEVLYNGIDPRIFHPKKKKPTSRLMFLYTGAWVREKGIHVLLEALALLPPAVRKTAEVVIAGGPNLWRIDPDPKRAPYIAVVKHMLRGAGCRALGGVSPKRIARLCQRADWVMCPSVWREPFGLSALEAIACGTPVIWFEGGGMAEILTPSNSLRLTTRSSAVLARAMENILSGTIAPKKQFRPLFTAKNSNMTAKKRNALYLSCIRSHIPNGK